MRWFLLLVCAGAFAADGEWEILFDGKDTSQWTGGIGKPFPAGNWSVRDGCLYLSGRDRWAPLYSAKPYRDFELELEWKIEPGGNTGVKYLAKSGVIHPDFLREFWPPVWKGAATMLGIAAIVALIGWLRRHNTLVREVARAGVVVSLVMFGWGLYRAWTTYRDAQRMPTGLEYQMIDNTPNRGGMVLGAHRTASLYDLLPAAPDVGPLPAGQFNTTRIVVRGDSVEHWLNGKLALAYQLGSRQLLDAIANSKFRDTPGFGQPGEGYIELQSHRTPAWFRNIRIRNLSP